MAKYRRVLKKWDGTISFIIMLGLCLGLYKLLFGLHDILPFGKGTLKSSSHSDIQWVRPLEGIEDAKLLANHHVRPVKYKAAKYQRKRWHKKRRVKRHKRRIKHFKRRIKPYTRRYLARKIRKPKVKETKITHKRKLLRSNILPGIFEATYRSIQ